MSGDDRLCLSCAVGGMLFMFFLVTVIGLVTWAMRSMVCG